MKTGLFGRMLYKSDELISRIRHFSENKKRSFVLDVTTNLVSKVVDEFLSSDSDTNPKTQNFCVKYEFNEICNELEFRAIVFVSEPEVGQHTQITGSLPLMALAEGQTVNFPDGKKFRAAFPPDIWERIE